jgi:hypothetical protein
MRIKHVIGLVFIVAGAATAIASAQSGSSVKAVLMEGTVREIPEKKPGKLGASDEESLEFSWDGGAWKTPFSRIKTLYLSLSRRSTLVEVFGIPGAAVGAAKKRKLLLSIIIADGANKNRRCVFYFPEKVSREFLEAIETRSGRKVIYESEEARNSVEDQ